MAIMKSFTFTGNADQYEQFRNQVSNVSAVLTDFILQYSHNKKNMLEKTYSNIYNLEVEKSNISTEIGKIQTDVKQKIQELELKMKEIDIKIEQNRQEIGEISEKNLKIREKNRTQFIKDKIEALKKTKQYVDIKLESEEKGYATVEDYIGTWFDEMDEEQEHKD